jgi:CheY-like chemotaxis protein
MAGGLSRELGNIFATILGKSRLLLAHTHDEPLRDRLSGLEEAAWRGSDVLHRLSALASPLAGDTLGPVHVSTVVQDALALAQPTLGDDPEKRGASIEVVTDLGRTPLVQGNAAALREALVNIMLNAVDAMSQGGRVRVVTQPTGTGVEVMVEDTGEGIAEHVQRHAFDPFFTTRSPERLGLGLTVAQGLVTRCGGRMRIESVQGKGTRVTIWVPQLEQAPSASHPETTPEAATLPARPQGDGAEAAPGAVETIPAVPPTLSLDNRSSALPEDTAAPTRRGASILVLEDDAAVRSMLVEALTHAGHAVQTGADGQSALGMLESGRFDVVLTDFALPQCSGLVVARAVKRVSPNTPVVLITGWGHLLDPERLREHGVDLMLVKPFRVERVLSVVSDALRLRSVS